VSKHPAKKQPRTKPKQRPRAKVKAVRAWCPIELGAFDTMSDGTPILYPKKNASWDTWARVEIRVVSPLPRSRK